MIRNMDILIKIVTGAWDLFLESSIYVIFGLIVAGFLRTFLNPNYVVRNLGRGRFLPVFKAALLGIPIPL